jgi:CRISPR-associated protein Csb2
MIVLELHFPAGRYHATPWDHQVNEGVVEWPPSPWRLLRALLATWYHKARDAIDANVVGQLLERLTTDLPYYALPRASVGHTRHYMPLYRSSIDGKTTKVFDTFVHVGAEEPLRVIWPEIDLSVSQHQALTLLLHRLGYLGRAESWVEGRTAKTWDGAFSCRPLAIDDTPEASEDMVRLLATEFPATYHTWRSQTVEQLRSKRLAELQANAKARGRSVDKVKLSKKDQEIIEAMLPLTLFDALHADTSQLRRAGWSRPPGSRWVAYTRPRDIFDVAPQRRYMTHAPSTRPTVARFAVASQVLPRLTEALSVAERLHQALSHQSDGATVFTGCDSTKRPLQGHRHVHILCETHNRRGTITHVTLYAAMGFDQQARQGLDRLQRVWGHGGHDLQLVLLGVGQSRDFTSGRGYADACTLFGPAQVWQSYTPFVTTRHPKTYRDGRPKLDATGLQIGSPAHDLRRLLAESNRPAPVRVEPTSTTLLGGKSVSWLTFRTQRLHGSGRRAANRGHGFRLTFPYPVSGPIAVGYGAHFGLGTFVPVEDV